jgi:hypothetical protein
MIETRNPLFGTIKWPWLLALLTLIIAFTGLMLWFGNVFPLSRDPLFRGKPESEWVKNLKYNDDQQVKEWRGYGEEGVQVLIRGLEKANSPGPRAYRKYNRRLPVSLSRWLPAPKPDSTRGIRQCVVSLLSSLGNDSKSAVPVMIWTATNDEADAVRQSAITYFNSSEDENSIVNKLPPNQKKALLPALIRAIQDPVNWGLRNNAALALRYYPEQRDIVAPVLITALQDAEPHVRLLAAEALNRVSPDEAKKAGATSILVAITKNPDDQIAFEAVAALGHSGSQPDLGVPTLVECLQSTNTLIGCGAVWALEWAPAEFNSYSDRIIPALEIAAQRKDNVGGYAKVAEKRWKSRPDSKQGAK